MYELAWTGGSVGPKAGFDLVERKNLFLDFKFSQWSLGRVYDLLGCDAV
jgi:hypothetical protein